ncbi:MAG: HEAT repeat domain-containing protein [Kiritimatiellia bacterium]
MKLRVAIITVLITACQLSVSAAGPLTAAKWADIEKKELNDINTATLETIIKGAPNSFRRLFSELKPDYKSDPLELARIAALTQFIASKNATSTHNSYADELLTAAKNAKTADVACFFIDQLRWCATKKQTAGLKQLTQSEKKGVAAIAAIAALASERNFESQQKNIKSNVYSEYSAQLSQLRDSEKIEALMHGFAAPDIKTAGIAMRHAAQTDTQGKTGGKNTELWCRKLSSTTDPTRLIMLLDMLGTRGDPEAITALGKYIDHKNPHVSQAAQMAMIKIEPAAFVKALPPALKKLPSDHTTIMKEALLCVPIELVEKYLLKDYSNYSQPGRNTVMEILKTRKSFKGVELAVTAINSTADEEAKNGFRLLRDCAGPDQAEILINKLLEQGSARDADAENAVVAAAKRDTTGKYISLLKDAWNSRSDAGQAVSLLRTFGRIGNRKLLPLTEEALKVPDREVAIAATRALATWNNNAPVRTLLKIAYTSDNNKQRILAQRGIEKKLDVKGTDKTPYKKEWEKISSGEGDADMKKKLDAFFAK